MYAWIITKDHIADESVKAPSNLNAVGIHGPRDHNIPLEKIKNEGKYFQMFDDDRILYYEGYIYGDYDGYEPVQDFGMGNAGCTQIEYPNIAK